LKEEPVEAVLEEMRENIKLETVSSGVVNPRTGRPEQATIAFKVIFEARSPDEAQRVANELASLYLNENLKSRRELASETSLFLTEEASKLQTRVNELESALAIFKEENAGRLPELQTLNMRLMDRAERELQDVQSRIQQQEQTAILLHADLQLIPATVETGGMRRGLATREGQTLINPADQLEALQTRYVGLTARYAPDHPDVVRTRKEIVALEGQTGTSSIGAASSQLDAARTELASLQQRYSAEHPDVKRLQRTIANLQSEVARQPASGGGVTYAANPAHINLKTRIALAEQAMEALRQKEAELQAKLDEYELRIAGTPQVEREYLALSRDYSNAVNKYGEVSAKLLEAQLAETLETEQKGERFVLIEPPQLPQRPTKPNRIAIGLVGLLFSIAGGMGSVVLAELLDPSLRGAKSVRTLLGAPPLASIPYIQTSAERRNTVLRRVLGVLLIIAAVGAALWSIHTFVLPLDVAWFSLMRRLGG
ncbi:MAG: lipopolysaccharide biosynthesis protein, partial [Gammaproteobacteria bacterium]